MEDKIEVENTVWIKEAGEIRKEGGTCRFDQ